MLPGAALLAVALGVASVAAASLPPAFVPLGTSPVRPGGGGRPVRSVATVLREGPAPASIRADVRAFGSSGLTVASTLVLLNNTTASGNFLSYNGGGPEGVAYDQGQGTLYVADSLSNGLTILNATSFALVGTIRLPASPTALVYDPALGEVFVTVGSSVEVINDTTQQPVAHIRVGGTPNGLAYDPADGKVFAVRTGSGMSVLSTASDRVIANLSLSVGLGVIYDAGTGQVFATDFSHKVLDVVTASSDTFVRNISLPENPIAVAYDAAQGEVFVGGYDAWNLSVVNDTTDRVVANLSAAFAPYVTLQFDPGMDELFYFSTQQDGTSAPVAVYSGTSNTIVANISVGGFPDGAADDVRAGAIIASNYAFDTVSVINDTYDSVNGTAPVGLHPAAIAYDAATQTLDVAIPNAHRVDILSAATGHLVGAIHVHGRPFALVADPSLHEVFVANEGSPRIPVVSDRSDAIVANISLPHASTGIALDTGRGELFVPDDWSNVSVINATNGSIVATVDVGGYYPEGIAYDPARGEVFVADLGQGSGGSVHVIADTSDRVVATVKVGMDPVAVAYDPQRGDLLVANSGSASNNVSVICDQNDTVVGAVGVPGNPSALAYDPAIGKVFATGSSTASVSMFSDVSGGRTPVAVGEDPSGLAYDPVDHRVYAVNAGQGTVSALALPGYTVTLDEMGLPPGTSWSATLDGRTGTSRATTLAFDESNGTFAYQVAPSVGYVPVAPAGTVTVNGTNVSVPVRFSPEYALAFTETGLPSGSNWTVRVDGQSNTSDQPTILFEVVNGTHTFSVDAIAGYAVAPATGTLGVDGANVRQAIEFTASTYPVTFSESGLPAGTLWNVTLGGVVRSSTMAQITFGAPNGSADPFTIGSVVGFTASPTDGNVSVAGAPVAQDIQFDPLPGPVMALGWANVSASGGYSYCVGTTGRQAYGQTWENVSFSAVAWNGTPPYRYVWQFGDGSPNGSGAQVVHTFEGPGPSWSPNLTVVDATGATTGTQLHVLTIPPSGPVCTRAPSRFLGLPPVEGYAILLGLVLAAGAAVAAVTLRSLRTQRSGRTRPPERGTW